MKSFFEVKVLSSSGNLLFGLSDLDSQEVLLPRRDPTCWKFKNQLQNLQACYQNNNCDISYDM